MAESANFRRGAKAAKEASKGTDFARTKFFGLKDQEVAYIRFLMDADEWISVDQHQMVPTKPKPDSYKGENWPEKMGAVCRRDEAFSYGECYICDFLVGDGTKVRKPSSRVWAIAALREEIIGDGSPELGGPDKKGKVFGMRDKTREVTIPAREAKDGQEARPEQTIEEKDIVVVNLGYKNFFGIVEGYAERYGTVCDRDFWIKREGADQSTQYKVVPVDDPVRDKDGNVLSPKTHPERWAHEIVLEDVISERASDEFYAKFFDPRVTATEDGKVESTGAEAPKPENEIDEEKLAAMRDRVKSFGAQPASEETEEGVSEASSNGEAKEPAEAPPATAGMVDMG